MNREPVLHRGAGGQLSGSSGWFALTPAAQILPRGDRSRHATGHLANATDDSSRSPGDLEDATGRLENAPDGLEHATGHPSRHPGRLSRSPGESENAPARPERLPSEPEGSGAALRRRGGARRGSLAARREGIDGARERGVCALARAVFVPKGRWAVATGGAQGRRPERNPWTGTERCLSAPAGRRRFAVRGGVFEKGLFLCPSGAVRYSADAFHGLRIAQSSDAPPVATGRDPSGVERRGGWRGLDPHAREGDLRACSGEVPEGRHAPLASADLHAGGSGVRRG